MKRAFIKTANGYIHYRIGGVGNPPMILLHQTPRSSDEYAEVIPTFCENRLVIAMDTLGYGDSDPAPEWYTIEDYANTVIALMDTLDLRKAVLVGHHTGAKTALEIGASYPDRVDKLVLAGLVFYEEEARQRVIAQGGRWQGKMEKDGSHLTDIWQAGAAMGIEPALNHRKVIDFMKAGWRSEHGHWASAKYTAQAERITQIKCPTLLIWGTEDVKLLGQRGFHWRNIEGTIPNSKVTRIEGGTPYMINQMPRQFANHVLSFLENTDTS